MGYAAEAPYDAIHVGAAAPVVPQAVSWFFFFPVFVYFIQLKLLNIYRKWLLLMLKIPSMLHCALFFWLIIMLNFLNWILILISYVF